MGTTSDSLLGGTRSALAIGLVLALGACGGSREAAWEDDTTANNQDTPAVSQEEAQSALEQADAAWAERDDTARLQEAIDGYTAVTQSNPDDYDTWVKLSRAHYFMADCHHRFDEAKAEDMMSSFQSGTQAAERGLMSLSPEFKERMQAGSRVDQALEVLGESAVPALYWRASNLGKWASADSFATLLSYKDEIRAVMAHCLENDRDYFHWGPDRYFGVFFGRAPSFAGGDLERSKQHFEASLSREPNYFGTHVLMAQDYAVKAQDRAVFDEHIDFVLNGDPMAAGPELGPENRCEVRKAQRLQEQAPTLFE
jgi:hypothetical protein